MLNISLFIPGLFDTEIDIEDHAVSHLSSLEFLLARASRTVIPAESYNQSLGKQFGYLSSNREDVPVAAIGRLIDDDKRPEGFWLRADPVHLHADNKSLSLLDAGSFSLTQHDALALAACVRQSFNELGWELEVPVPTRWYVKTDSKSSIRTSELQEVTGQDIQKYMPEGEDAGIWHRLMNEIQMQLHNADINQLRVERGELAINSLWLWGTGSLPDLLERRWSRVYSDDNTTMGLSMLSNTPCFPLPVRAEDVFRQLKGNAEILVVMSEFQTAMLQREQRRGQLEQFENDWCHYLLEQLQNGTVQSLKIITRSREFKINKRSLMKFWKRAKPFNSYVD
jgi:hypothetical protein